jgi:hypothetical protein
VFSRGCFTAQDPIQSHLLFAKNSRTSGKWVTFSCRKANDSELSIKFLMCGRFLIFLHDEDFGVCLKQESASLRIYQKCLEIGIFRIICDDIPKWFDVDSIGQRLKNFQGFLVLLCNSHFILGSNLFVWNVSRNGNESTPHLFRIHNLEFSTRHKQVNKTHHGCSLSNKFPHGKINNDHGKRIPMTTDLRI